MDRSNVDYTIFVNSTAPYSPFLAMNEMNNAIFKTLSNKKKPKIISNMVPFGFTKHILSFEADIHAILAAILLPLGMSFIPASMIVFTVRERENNAKHL